MIAGYTIDGHIGPGQLVAGHTVTCCTVPGRSVFGHLASGLELLGSLCLLILRLVGGLAFVVYHL